MGSRLFWVTRGLLLAALMAAACCLPGARAAAEEPAARRARLLDPFQAKPKQAPRVKQAGAQSPVAGSFAGERAEVVAAPHFEMPAVDLSQQTADEAAAKSFGCIQCHENACDPHGKETVRLGCCDCHGGNPTATSKHQAHVAPRFPDAWVTSANPVRSYTLLNHESPEFIRFVNPGDLRVAAVTCGCCHPREVLGVRKSMMTHGCMLWGAALYNNGAVPIKASRYGESYSMHGAPQRLQNVPPPTPYQLANKAMVPFLDPLPRFEISQPANVLRIFERGGRFRPEVGIPEPLEESGKPRTRLSLRGLGTENRTDPVFIGLQKTRLLDPTLNFLGTNDHPGDFRSGGCTACHMIYANDRSPVHSGPYAKFGHMGLSHSSDPTIPKDEPGHPIEHKFTLSIPTSQCITCHIHPGTNVLNSYLGFMWWDNETDGDLMYPAQQKYPSSEEVTFSQMSNPDETAARGLWSDPEFLARVSDLNTEAKHSQFADFHGHGWVYRAVFKKDRAGNLLDYRGRPVLDATTEKLLAAMVPPSDEEREQGKERDCVPVHLMDIHLEKGMHCIDCHFNQDNHGNTKLYGEVRAAIEITCIDCHGTLNQRATLITSGPAAPEGKPGVPAGTNLKALRTPFGKPRFEIQGDRIIQHSMVEKDLSWDLVQTMDTVDPQNKRYNVKSHMAKTVRTAADGKLEWGGHPNEGECAHKNEAMSCIACHSSWNPSCFGCHLPQKANRKMPSLHYEGDVSRNYVSYNFQTLRDDVYMLAKDGDATKNRIGPARSSCAIHVGSYNNNRESIYVQQQTISGDGMAGIAFSTNVPHTVRGGPRAARKSRDPADFVPGSSDTKSCTDCHVSSHDDNNATMAQLLMHGTGFVNFIGRYCWVAGGETGFSGVVVTEAEEPQAVVGSTLHQIAYPDHYRKHVANGGLLKIGHHHPGRDVSETVTHPFRKNEIRAIQARGEYLYAACGEGGMRIFDIAFIDNKGFSQRVPTAPVSPLGQRFFVPMKYCTAIAAPATIVPDPTRKQHPENKEQPIHAMYGFVYALDKYEGLILVRAGTLLDGNPLNNFLERALTYNPKGILVGATNISIVGTYAYISCDAGLVVVSLEDPEHPRVTAILGQDELNCPKVVQFQFRYGFVCDNDGIKVLDVTNPDRPCVVGALALPEARNIYVARTYAYVAGGKAGLIILNITDPEQPRVDQVYNADGRINDLYDVKLGITNASEFAYLADGCNGMKVVQLTSPETPGSAGFSPRPDPCLIAYYKMPHGGPALAISRGVDRDRAVDESGNQIAVFGRVGARPLNAKEQQKMYLRQGQVWKVSDFPFDPQVYRWPKEIEAMMTAPPEAIPTPAAAERQASAVTIIRSPATRPRPTSPAVSKKDPKSGRSRRPN